MQIDRGLAASERGTDAGCRVVLGIAAIQLATARGSAAAIATTAGPLGVRTASVGALPDLLRRWCAVAEAETLVAAGSPAAAIDLLGAPGETIGLAGCLERLVLARAHLALDATERTMDLLDPMLEPDLPYRTQAVQARVVRAQAQLAQGLDVASTAALAEAVNLAEHEGVIGPFVTAGASIVPLLERIRNSGGRHRDFSREVLAVIAAGPG